MLSCLLSSDVADFKKLECQKASEIKVDLFEHGVWVEDDVAKETMLEKLYLVLLEKATTEKGL